MSQSSESFFRSNGMSGPETPRFGRKGLNRVPGETADNNNEDGLKNLISRDADLQALSVRYQEIRAYQEMGEGAGANDEKTLDEIENAMIKELKEKHGISISKVQLERILEAKE